MKFIEYFEQSRPTGVKLLLLGGDDTALKNNIRLEYIKQNSGLTREYTQTGDVQDLTLSMEEGCFYGPRFFDVFFMGKVKNSTLWNNFFNIASASEHTMILCFEGEGGGWTDHTFKSRPGVLWFDCNFPKSKRERTKIVSFLLGHRKIILENADLVKEIVNRVKTSLELENLLTCLKLLLECSPKVTLKDLRLILAESEQVVFNARDLMGGNISRLSEAIDIHEPIPLLTFWFSVLTKFYCFLVEDATDVTASDMKNIKDDDDNDEKSSAALSAYQLREYEVAKGHYSPPLIRVVLEELNAIYQDCRKGRDEHWKERARVVIQSMAIKA